MIACLDQNEFKIEKIQLISEKKRENFSIPGPSTQGCQPKPPPPPPSHHQILRIDRKGMTDKMTSYRTKNDIIWAKNAR